MRHFIILAAVAALASSPAFAQKLDKNGRCHDASGRFAKADVCKSSAKAPPAAVYKLDAKGKCHDAKGKMSKKELCAAK